MSIQLKTDEMLEIIHAEIDPKIGAIYETILINLSNQMARTIQGHAGVRGIDLVAGEASFEGCGFAGTCVPFSSICSDAPIPEFISGYDDEGWE